MSFNVSCSILGIKGKGPMRERMVVGQEKVKARELHRYILRSIHERQLGPSTLIYMDCALKDEFLTRAL